MVDLFEEVEEQLRSDRYRELARRIAPWATAIFALVLIGYLGVWGYKAYQDRNLSTAALAYQRGVDALAKNDQAGALGDFRAASQAGASGYTALALMQQGALSSAAGRAVEAAALFDQAAKSAPNPIVGDLASLRAALALLDTAPYAEMQRRLTPLADAKRPFSLYAREALANAKLLAGRTVEARRDFSVLTASLGAPEDLRQRAQLAITLIDSGQAAVAIAAVRAAATLPPPAPATLTPPPPGTSDQAGPTGTPPAGAAP